MLRLAFNRLSTICARNAQLGTSKVYDLVLKRDCGQFAIIEINGVFVAGGNKVITKHFMEVCFQRLVLLEDDNSITKSTAG